MQKPVPIRAEGMTNTEVGAAALVGSAERHVPAEPVAPAPSGEHQAARWFHGSVLLWRSSWTRSLAIFTICSILLAWSFRSEISAAVHVWSTSSSFGHAFFIFPITLFLFYRLRHQLAALKPRAVPYALIPIAGAMLLWTIGELANVMVVKQLAFVAAWQSLFLLVFGWQVTRASTFPLAYLVLAVPFGLSLIPTLQHVTAQVAVYLLRLSGVPVFLENYYIEIPNASFLVAEACSGIRYLTVCIALGILAAHLFFRSWVRRMVFVALAIIVPIVANGIRAYGIVMIAHYGRHEFAIDVDHVISGFVFLSVVTLSLLGLGALFRDRLHGLWLNPPGPAVGNQVPAFDGARAIGQAGWAVVAAAIVFSAQAWVEAVKAPPPNLTVVLRTPDLASPWTIDSAPPAWSPIFQGTDTELQKGYRRGEERVDIQVGYYAYQRDGAEAVSDLNTITGRADLKVLRSTQTSVQIADVSLPVNELVILYAGRRYLVWYWYRIGGDNTSSRLVGKLLELKALASGGERAAAIIAVNAEVSENVEGTVALLNSFLQEGLGKAGVPYQVDTSPVAAVGVPESPPDLRGGVTNQ